MKRWALDGRWFVSMTCFIVGALYLSLANLGSVLRFGTQS